MLKFFTLPLFLFYFALANAAPSTAANQTKFKCQGQTKLCEDCNKEYFNFFVLQNATIQNGEILNETHVFKFSGFLKDNGDFNRVRLNKDHILYQNSKYQLAVPHAEQSKGLWIKKKETQNVMLGPNEGPKFKWVKLCN